MWNKYGGWLLFIIAAIVVFAVTTYPWGVLWGAVAVGLAYAGGSFRASYIAVKTVERVLDEEFGIESTVVFDKT